MPIFEYKCNVCNHKSDELHRSNEVLQLKCTCGGDMEKQLSTPAGIVRGSPFPCSKKS